MKYCGNIGFMHTVDEGDGIWREKIVQQKLYGDVLDNYTSRWQNTSTQQNDNLSVSARISIVANAFAFHNFSEIRYAEWMGAKWTVSSVDVQPPRLILTLGGVYNGED